MIESCPWWIVLVAGIGLGAAPARVGEEIRRFRERRLRADERAVMEERGGDE
jgi:hypothetical protein